MNVLSLSGVSKALADAPLFEDVTLGIDSGDKIGFIGRNGSGKSTFLKILSGEMQPDAGSVSRNRELTISMVEQMPSFRPDTRLDDFLFLDRTPVPEPDRKSTIVTTFRSYCRELGLQDPAATMGSFSGGMVRKASLARCLAFGSGFLALDEPTNHLDLDTIEWLEAMLRDSARGFIVVTHDRRFLDATCKWIMEIEGRRIYKYPGNYSEYLDRKAARAAAAEGAERRRGAVLRTELEWLKRGPKARTGKDKARKERIQDLLDAAVAKERAMEQFSSAHRRLGKKVLELRGASMRYGTKVVVRPFTYEFRRGERIGIIGPNGSGKTTFLALASGRIAPDSGTVVKGETTVFAHFDQISSHADGELTALDYVREHAERIPMADGSVLSPEQFLERFLFPRPMQSQALQRLSGGELRRLELVRLLAGAPNFLLLDEPTNDLDLDTIRLLEDYLADFPGCMLLVSHDRALLDRLTDYLFLFDGQGGIRGFAGNYQEYRDSLAEEAREARAAEKAERPRLARREKKAELSFKERQEHEALLHEIEALEQEQKDLELLFQQPVPDPTAIASGHRRYREIEGLLAAKMARWEELAARV